MLLQMTYLDTSFPGEDRRLDRSCTRLRYPPAALKVARWEAKAGARCRSAEYSAALKAYGDAHAPREC